MNMLSVSRPSPNSVITTLQNNYIVQHRCHLGAVRCDLSIYCVCYLFKVFLCDIIAQRLKLNLFQLTVIGSVLRVYVTAKVYNILVKCYVFSVENTINWNNI